MSAVKNVETKIPEREAKFSYYLVKKKKGVSKNIH